MTQLSVLDLSPIVQGGDATLSFQCSLDLARQAERLGFGRYWLAEHHNMPGIGSSPPHPWSSAQVGGRTPRAIRDRLRRHHAAEPLRR